MILMLKLKLVEKNNWEDKNIKREDRQRGGKFRRITHDSTKKSTINIPSFPTIATLQLKLRWKFQARFCIVGSCVNTC